ncbi:hypothetical protein BVY04_05120, partial [bacterium M21]
TDVCKHLGRTYIRTGKAEKGLKIWNQLLADNPDEDLQEELVDLQLEEGLFEEALASLATLKTKTKDKYRAIMLDLRESEIHARLDHKDKARKLLKESLGKVAQGAWLEREILARIERLFRLEGDTEGLLSFYEELTTENKQNTALLARYVTVLQEDNRLEEASKIAAELVKVAPLERSYRERLIEVLADSNKYDDALAQLDELQKRFPKDIELSIRRAAISHRAKKGEQVKAALLEYLTNSDGGEYDYLRVARIYGKFSMPDDAEKTFQVLLKKHPNSIEGKENYAEHCFRTDKKAKGTEIYSLLAKKADMETLLRIDDALSLRSENETAYQLLNSRRSEFEKDPAYLRHLCKQERSLEKNEAALKTAMMWVENAEGGVALGQAIAEVLSTGGKLKKLESIIAEVGAKKPTDLTIGQACLLAELHYNSGDEGEAEKTLEAAATRHASSELLVDRRLNLAKRMQALDRAIEILDAELKKDGNRKTGYLRELAQLHRQNNNPTKALEAVERWKTLASNSTQPYLTEAAIHRDSADSTKAIKTLKKAILRLNGKAEVLQTELASIYMSEGMTKDAKHVYWQLLENVEKLEDKLQYVTSLAQSYQYSGDMTELTRHFQERMASDKKALFPILAMVRIHQASGNYEELRRYAMKASEMRPDDIGMLHEIARIEEQNGAYDRSESLLRKAAGLDKSDRSKQLLVRHYFKIGEDEKGLELYLQFKNEGKMAAKEIETIGSTLIGSRRYDLAVEFLRGYANMFDKNLRLHYLYAVALKEVDRRAEARREFIRILNCRHEPQRNKKKMANSPLVRSSYYDHMKQIFPEKAIEITEGMNYSWQVFQYRQANQNTYYGMGRNQQGIRMPDSLKEVPYFITVQLSEDYALMDTAE